LAHLIDRRFREIRWYLLGWLLALALGLFLHGTDIGLGLIGLAIGLHAWIAVQHSLLRRIEGLRARLGVVVLVLIALAVIYWLIPRLIVPDLTGGHTNLTLPHQNIRQADYLLAWRDRVSEPPLPRGSLVLTRLGSIGQGRMGRAIRGDQTMAVQIVGLPGETITADDDSYYVDGQPLDSEKYPLPQWLRRRGVYARLAPDSYFVSSEYNVQVHGRIEVTQSHVRTVCVVAREAIEARAFMRWLPLSRRGFIEEIE
jgi:hypothetical protein